MRVPEGFERRDTGALRAVVRADLATVPLDAWWSDGPEVEGAAGRGGVVRLAVEGADVVARRYRRGGALRRVLPDLFATPTRAFRELETIERLRIAGVPVVEPLAAVARRRGVLWELRLCTSYMVDARTLPAFIAAEPELRAAAIEATAIAVAAAFDAGLCHPDLHPDNVLARSSARRGCSVALLDFDRARVEDRPAPRSARDDMLVRMARYLRKHADRLPVSDRVTDHLRFLRGLGLDRAGRRSTFRRLNSILERQLRRRGLDPDRSHPA